MANIKGKIHVITDRDVNNKAIYSVLHPETETAQIVDFSSATDDKIDTKLSTFASTLPSTYLNINGNANSATVLQTAREINISDADGSNVGTAIVFNGASNGTIKLPNTIKAALSGTANTASTLKTARKISISSYDSTNKSVAVDFDGSKDINITLSSTIKANLDGTANTASTLKTARTIAISGGATGTATSFDGSSDISIPITSLDATQLTGTATIDTTGNASTATTLKNSRTINVSDVDGTNTGAGASFNGSSAITIALPGTIKASLNGNADTATKLANKKTINISDADGTNTGTAISFDGSDNGTIKLPSTIKASLSGNADTATKATKDSSGNNIISTYATKVSPVLTGTPVAPTAAAGTATDQIATTKFVSNTISNLVGAAPDTLDTLAEISEAINNDASVYTTLNNAITNKQDKHDALTSISSLSTAANKMIYTTAANTYAVTTLTAAARNLLDDANVSTMRSTLEALGRTEKAISAVTADTAATCTGNANTATTLETSRNINISDADGTNTGTAISFNGSSAGTIKLPSTIKASLTGNASTATKLANKRSINIADADETNVGTAISFDGSNTTTLNIKLPNTIKASLTGNADTATKATLDSKDQDIADTYIKSLSVSGKTITYTKGDGDTGTFTTQDTTYANATTSTAGLMTAADKTKLNGIADSANAVSFTQSLASGTEVGKIVINGATTTLYCQTNSDTKVSFTSDTSGTTYPLLFKNTTGSTTTAAGTRFNTSIYATPSTGTITATNFNGLAAKATADGSGNNIISTYATKAEVTTNSAGLMTAADKTKLNGISEDADAVSFTQSLTSGTKVGEIVINGVTTTLYCQTNSDAKVSFTSDTSGTTYPLLFKNTTGSTTTAAGTRFNTSIYATPSTGTITATNFNGLATKATADSSGNNIVSTYATKVSPILTGTPVAPTATVGTATDQIATTKFVSNTISNLVGAAPDTLDTLAEISEAINNDASVYTTLNNAITNKQDKHDALTSISSLSTAANKMIYTTASNTYAVTTLTATARSLLDDADTAAMRTTLDVPTRTGGSASGTWGISISGTAAKATGDGSGNNIVSTYATKADAVHSLSASGKTITFKNAAGTSLGTFTTQDTTYVNATTSTAGLMAAADKTKLNGIADGADAVSFTQSLASGTKVGEIVINGATTILYCQTNSDTHWTTHLIAGASATATANATVSSGNVFINVLDNSTVRNSLQFKSGSNMTITSDSSGIITFTAADTTYSAATTNLAGLMSATDKSKLDGITASADAVSFTQSLTSGTEVGKIVINGATTALYCQTNTNTDTLVTQNVSTTNATYPILASVTANAAANQGAKTTIFSSGIKINPSTSTIYATTFSGNLTGNVTGNVSGSAGSCTGNAATATKATQDGSGNNIVSTYMKKYSYTSATVAKTTTTTETTAVNWFAKSTTINGVAYAQQYRINVTNLTANDTIELEVTANGHIARAAGLAPFTESYAGYFLLRSKVVPTNTFTIKYRVIYA